MSATKIALPFAQFQTILSTITPSAQTAFMEQYQVQVEEPKATIVPVVAPALPAATPATFGLKLEGAKLGEWMKRIANNPADAKTIDKIVDDYFMESIPYTGEWENLIADSKENLRVLLMVCERHGIAPQTRLIRKIGDLTEHRYLSKYKREVSKEGGFLKFGKNSLGKESNQFLNICLAQLKKAGEIESFGGKKSNYFRMMKK